MERNDFDKMLRDRLGGVTEPAPDVWEGIRRGLVRRHRRVLLGRFATGAVAVAAGLAVALLVFRGPQPGRHFSVPVRTAHAVLPAASPEIPAAPPQEAVSIAAQIEVFTKSRSVAQAVVKKTAPEEVFTPEQIPPEQILSEPAPSGPSGPSVPSVPSPADVVPAAQEEAFMPDDGPTPRKHTSTLSILSNFTTVASDKDLIYKASPMHSSSQTGNRATSVVEPVAGTPKFFSPLSLGVQIEVPLSGRFSVASGVTYTYLVSQYDMLVDKVRYDGAYNQLHYVGIPLSLSWHFFETSSFKFYASAGAAVEKCVAQRYVFASNTLREKVGGLQWSARAGLGAEYGFTRHLALYFDPSLVYFFDNKQPLSIRTQQPLQTRFELGLRFRL